MSRDEKIPQEKKTHKGKKGKVHSGRARKHPFCEFYSKSWEPWETKDEGNMIPIAGGGRILIQGKKTQRG